MNIQDEPVQTPLLTDPQDGADICGHLVVRSVRVAYNHDFLRLFGIGEVVSVEASSCAGSQ